MKKHRPILPLDQYNERKKEKRITVSFAIGIITYLANITTAIIFTHY